MVSLHRDDRLVVRYHGGKGRSGGRGGGDKKRWKVINEVQKLLDLFS